MSKKIVTKNEILDHLYGTLAMCDGSMELGHSGGKRRVDMQKKLVNQIARRIMHLQGLIESNELLGDTSLVKTK